MTPIQVAINHAAITEAASQLSRVGYEGDAHRFCEQLVLTAIGAGYRKLEPPPPSRPVNVATDAQRAAHIEAAKAEVEAARRKRQETK